MVKKWITEFRNFAMRGNVVDMAVGIIIGGAFGKLVTSLVNDVVMPPIGLLTGQVDFGQLYINLSDSAYESLEAATAAGAPVIRYGAFINTILDFVIVAASIFVAIRIMNQLRTEQETKPAAPPPPSAEEKLLTEIRDLLKSGR
ncbi:MAG TPA: large-conductance mechanosensitive channel protein MscL [Vicinamibacteria bacterium]|nr:large-conductance mechanosensitive channel protein MscL [Vicinamibacteria bacterium]